MSYSKKGYLKLSIEAKRQLRKNKTESLLFAEEVAEYIGLQLVRQGLVYAKSVEFVQLSTIYRELSNKDMELYNSLKFI